MKNGKCIKCTTGSVIQVKPLDRGDGNAKLNLCVATYDSPDAWIFKGEKKYDLVGYACTGCGYVEFYLK